MTSKDFLAGDKVRRLQLQLKLDAPRVRGGHHERVDDPRRPRPIACGLAAVLQELLPDPSQGHELVELTAPERATLYRLAGIPIAARIQYEDGVRRALRRRYRKAAA